MESTAWSTLIHPGQSTPPTGQNITGSVPLARTIVDDGSGLTTYYGRPEPVALDALRAGHAVVADPTAVNNGSVSFDLELFPSGASPGNSAAVAATNQGQPTPRRVTVPATAIAPTDPATPLIILPPSLATTLHITTAQWGVLTRDTRAPSAQQQQAAMAAINSIDPAFQLNTETGYHDQNSWLPLSAVIAAAIIAVVAAMIATALANVDGQNDLVTLGAVGASPRTRRLLAMSRAGLVATLGTAVGVIAGFVAPAAWVLAVHRQPVSAALRVIGDGRLLPAQAALHLAIPWTTVIVLLTGIPLIAALVAAATSRSRLPSERQG